jgi:HK97 family phage portal protein
MFLTQIAASDVDRSPYGEFWFEPVSVTSLSGMRVSADTAMRLSAVFRAVSLISGHMGMLPIRFFVPGSRTPVTDHPLVHLLNCRPNQWQNAFEWREMLQGHLELRGNAYNEIVIDGAGAISALLPLHPDRVKVEWLDNGDYRYKLQEREGQTRTLPRGAVWHIRGLSNNGVVGLSTIEHARESMGLGLAAQDYGARFFANDAKPSGGWIEFPGQFADKEARIMFRDTWQQMQGGMNRGKTAVLDRGMKLHELGAKNSDAQFLETRRFQISEIARWFGVPPHKLGDLDKATFSNIEQQALEYVQDALLQRAKRWEASIASELLLESEKFEIRYDFRELLRGDSAQRAGFYHQGIMDGWLTRNEARKSEDLEPIEGLDEPLRPLNMVEEDEAEGTESAEQTEPKAPEDENASARLKRVLLSNAARLARRTAAGKMPGADVIADSLGVSVEAAEEWARAHADTTKDEHALTASLAALGLRA